MPAHVADDEAMRTAIETVRTATEGRDLVLTAEAPVSWPSGAFVRVDRLTDEARACIVRSADFAAAIGSPVLTIHLYAPLSPEEFRSAPPPDDDAIQQFLRFYALTCFDRGVTPLIENVPPVLRMRVGGSSSPRSAGTGATCAAGTPACRSFASPFDTSHAALFQTFATAYGSLFGVAADEELGLATYVEELGARARDGARLGRARPARRGPPARRRRARPRPGRSTPRRARASSSSRRSTSRIRPARRT